MLPKHNIGVGQGEESLPITLYASAAIDHRLTDAAPIPLNATIEHRLAPMSTGAIVLGSLLFVTSTVGTVGGIWFLANKVRNG